MATDSQSGLWEGAEDTVFFGGEEIEIEIEGLCGREGSGR